MDFQACGDDAAVKFAALENRTMGEYFVDVVIPKVVNKVKDEVNIAELNMKYKTLAKAGLKAVQNSCNICNKTCAEKDGSKSKCISCNNTRAQDPLHCLETLNVMLALEDHQLKLQLFMKK